MQIKCTKVINYLLIKMLHYSITTFCIYSFHEQSKQHTPLHFTIYNLILDPNWGVIKQNK